MHVCDPRDLDKSLKRNFKNEDFFKDFLHLNQDVLDVVVNWFPHKQLEAFEFTDEMKDICLTLDKKYSASKEDLLVNNNAHVEVWTTTLGHADMLQMLMCVFAIIDVSEKDIEAEIKNGIYNFNSYNKIYKFTENELGSCLLNLKDTK